MSPRSSQRVDRRRRVLHDESRREGSVARPRIFRGDNDGPLCPYNAAALQAINAPIARYLPTRQYSLCVWFLVGLLPILGLMLLDQNRQTIAGQLGGSSLPSLRAIDMAAPGSLLGWFSSLVFAACVLLMLAIYSVRRHRRDDYRARFAAWQWVMVVAFLASIDVATGLHDVVQVAGDRFFGALSWGAGSGWWVGGWACVVGLTMVRLLVEMSASRGAIVSLLLGGTCYSVCALVQIDAGGVANTSMAGYQLPLLLLGHHFVLFSLVQYARHVILEAMGLVQAPEKTSAKIASAKATAERATESAAKKSDKASAKTNVAETLVTKKAKPNTSPTVKMPDPEPGLSEDRQNEEENPRETNAAKSTMKVVSDSGESEVDISNLSKSERRRLKKEQRRAKRAA